MTAGAQTLSCGFMVVSSVIRSLLFQPGTRLRPGSEKRLDARLDLQDRDHLGMLPPNG